MKCSNVPPVPTVPTAAFRTNVTVMCVNVTEETRARSLTAAIGIALRRITMHYAPVYVTRVTLSTPGAVGIICI